MIVNESTVAADIGQTAFHPHHIPGTRQCYGDEGEGCEEEIFGLGQTQKAGGAILAGVGAAGVLVNGLFAWYMIKSADKMDGFWKFFGYAGGALSGLAAIYAMALMVGGTVSALPVTPGATVEGLLK